MPAEPVQYHAPFSLRSPVLFHYVAFILIVTSVAWPVAAQYLHLDISLTGMIIAVAGLIGLALIFVALGMLSTYLEGREISELEAIYLRVKSKNAEAAVIADEVMACIDGKSEKNLSRSMEP